MGYSSWNARPWVGSGLAILLGEWALTSRGLKNCDEEFWLYTQDKGALLNCFRGHSEYFRERLPSLHIKNALWVWGGGHRKPIRRKWLRSKRGQWQWRRAIWEVEWVGLFNDFDVGAEGEQGIKDFLMGWILFPQYPYVEILSPSVLIRRGHLDTDLDREDSHLQPRTEAQNRSFTAPRSNQPCWCLDLGFQASNTVNKKKFLL